MNKNDIYKLKEFLVEAKRSTYAAGDTVSKIIEPDFSTTLEFSKGDYSYHDNYHGGEPYGGRETVSLKGRPIYFMGYYGRVYDGVDLNLVYPVLQEALRLIPFNEPFRGPMEHLSGNFKYSNSSIGNVCNFYGSEVIYQNGVIIYEAKYVGGLIDIRR